MSKVRVRYAPSPTGYLHIGNARTALFNYLFAKHNGGDFVVRIEDTDVARNIEGGEKSQLDNLKWLGVEWDESIDKEGNFGPYNQLARHEAGIYTKYVDQLLAEGKAYKCYCSSEELDTEAERQKAEGMIPRYNGRCSNLSDEEIANFEAEGRDFTVRFRVPINEEISWTDIVKNEVTFNSKDISGDFNILKRDGIPTYNFAVVIDDHLMEISHVLRGEDHISNTPKQIMLYNAMDMAVPTFGHMTLIVNPDGKKLSKRDTSIIQFIEQYKDLGYLPEAMFNFITLLGWSPVGEEEIFGQEELIKIFDETRLSKSPAKFDEAKLTWINNQYVKQLTEDEYYNLVLPFLQKDLNVEDSEWLKAVSMLYKDQLSFGQEITELVSLFFKDEISLDAESLEFVKQEGVKETLNALKGNLEAAEDFTAETIKGAIKAVQKDLGVKGKMLFMPSRIATTGQMHGPDLTSSVSLLGREKAIANIDFVISQI